MADKKKGSKGGLLHNIFVILISTVFIVTLKAGFIFFLLGLLPTVLAFIIDDHPRKHVYKAVLACNLAGMLPPLSHMVGTRVTSSALQGIISDPAVWLLIYGSAAAGWALVWICRGVAMMYMSVYTANRLSALERAQQRLVEEWGPNIRRRDLMG